VEKRGLNLAGVQLALELTRQLRWLQQTNRAKAELDLDAELDSLLCALGFVDQSRITGRSAEADEQS
jgi:hypothetical protein